MADFFNSLVGYFKDRVENQLFLYFIFSWCVWNHDFWFKVFFYSGDVKDYVLSSHVFGWCGGLLFPFATAVFFLLFSEVANNGVQWGKYKLINKFIDGVKTEKDFYNNRNDYNANKKKEAELVKEREAFENEKSGFESEKYKLLREAENSKSEIDKLERELKRYSVSITMVNKLTRSLEDPKVFSNLFSKIDGEIDRTEDFDAFEIKTDSGEDYKLRFKCMFVALDPYHGSISSADFLNKVRAKQDFSFRDKGGSLVNISVGAIYRLKV